LHVVAVLVIREVVHLDVVTTLVTTAELVMVATTEFVDVLETSVSGSRTEVDMERTYEIGVITVKATEVTVAVAVGVITSVATTVDTDVVVSVIVTVLVGVRVVIAVTVAVLWTGG
jgi:hypothetical protein